MTGTVDPKVLAPLKGAAKFDFGAAAQQTFADFPELKRNLILFNGEDDKFYGDNGLFERLKTSVAAKEDGTTKTIVEFARDSPQEIGSAILPFGFVNVYARAKGDMDDLWFPVDVPEAIKERMAYEHEIGHAVVPGGLDGHQIIPGTEKERPNAENRADAFLGLQILKLYGGEAASVLDSWSRERSFTTINANDPDHLTTFALDKIVLEAKSADFLSLSPAETAAVAQRHAQEFTPPDKDLLQMLGQFSPLQKKLKTITAKNTEPLRELAEIITAEGANPYAVYMGARLLRPFLEPGGADFKSGKYQGRIELTGKYWEGMKDKISTALQRLPDDHILRELDLNRLDITGRVPAPQGPVKLLSLAQRAFNTAAAADTLYAVSNIELDQTPEKTKGLAPATVDELLAALAQPGMLDRETDTLVTQPLKDKLHAVVREQPGYSDPVGILLGESRLGMSLHMFHCAGDGGKNNKDSVIYVLADHKRHSAIALGDGPLPARFAQRLEAKGVAYGDRNNYETAAKVDEFVRASSLARREYAPGEVVGACVQAFSCVVELPQQYLKSEVTLKDGVGLGILMTNAPAEPTLYTTIMKPASNKRAASTPSV